MHGRRNVILRTAINILESWWAEYGYLFGNQEVVEGAFLVFSVA